MHVTLVYIKKMLKCTFNVGNYAPLHEEQPDESLWTESNGVIAMSLGLAMSLGALS